jgi:predicted flap endonuclease-1-like 5' DNA nuclease
MLRQLPGATSELFQCDSEEPAEGTAASASLLPRWLQSEELSRFCRADAVESDDLRMLHRLAAVGEVEYGSARELERARQALAQVLSDRDGNGLEGGIVHRISELRRGQGELQRRITALRDTGAETRKRTVELRRQLSECELRLSALAEESSAVESERQQLLQISAGAAAVTAVPRSDLLQRWQKLRVAAAADLESLRETAGACLMLSSESLSAMRESILRMDERFRRLSEAGHAGGIEELDMGLAGTSLQQVRQEVTSLNNRLADYEQQLERQRPADPLQLLIEQAIIAIDAVLSELGDSPKSAGTEIASATGQQGTAALQQLNLKRNQLEQESHQLQRRLAELTAALQSPTPVTLSAQALEQLDQLQAEYGELDAVVQRLEQQRRQLDGAERRLREAIEHLALTRGPGVLMLASSFLQRLTEGALRTVQLEGHELAVVPTAVTGTVGAVPVVKLAGLPRTQRLLVCLAVRLALLRICGAIDGIVPLMLNDELLRLDTQPATPLVELLSESAEQGQQLLWLIEDSHLPALQGVQQLEVRQLSAASAVRELPPPPPRLVLHTVEHAEPLEPVAITTPPITSPPTPVAATVGQQLPEVPVALTSEVLQHGGANWLFYLELDHGVEDLAGISLGELEALRAAKYTRVVDLLDRTVPELEEAIRLRGYMVPVERLQALRGQAELATRVPMLRRGDAALLFAAGITSADELRKLRPEAVYEKITAFQRSDAGARWRRSGRLIDRQQALNWARFGQFSKTQEELQAARSLVRAAVVAPGKPVRKPLLAADPSDAPTAPAAAEQTNAGSRVIVTRRRKQVEVAPASAARRAKRVARREQLAAQLRVDPQAADTAEGQPVERIGGMRFFLSRTSDVVQAPSIGPKTAEILHGAGVRTIEELLNVAPERIAEKLNQKRLTADIIRRWQVQAQLVCRIPELRGHDAQILAASGISTPESLASRTPAELLAAMKPFLETAEGRRVLRNQNGPDLEEVTEWIQWAANARPLRAA